MKLQRSLPFLAGLALFAPAIVPSATPATKPLAAQLDGWVAHLVAPGDRMEIGYAVQNAASAPAATLYVRNDLGRSFQPVQMTYGRSKELRAVVPVALIRGRRLLYYAVIRDPQTGHSVTVPAGGVRAPQVVWVLEQPIVVRLGTHQFGETRTPEAVVARTRPEQVGWQNEGDPSGPETFLVDRNRSIWLHDEINHRLLVWRADRPDAAPRSVTLPFLNAEDVVLGPANSLYFDRGDPILRRFFLYRMSLATGKVLWRSELRTGDVGGNTALRVGPDGTLYAIAADLGWVPVATPAGRPLSPVQQRQGAGYQPVGQGLRLLTEQYSPYAGDAGSHPAPQPEVRVALIDRAGRLVRAWRIFSRTAIAPTGYYTPALVGGDPVVVLDATARSGGACGGPNQPNCSFKWEYLVLRLGRGGATRRFSLQRTIYGDNLFADLRVGPDGKLYQLGSSPKTGIAVSRYSLQS